MNEILVQATGETHFVRDRAALEGALNRPITYYEYEDVKEVHFLAGYLILAVGKAHAFEQGNKRTAWAAGRIFLFNNGYRVILDGELQQTLAALLVEKTMVDEATVKQLIHFLGKAILPVG